VTHSEIEFMKGTLKEAVREGIISEDDMEAFLSKLEIEEALTRGHVKRMRDALDAIMSGKSDDAVPA
jgi:hypothetical protein